MSKWAFPLQWLIFSTCYLILAFLCLMTRDYWSLCSTIWLPAGLTLGVLCTSTLARWPLWIVTTGLLHIFASVVHQRPLDISLVFGLNDLVILCFSAHIWRSIEKHQQGSSQLTRVVIFIFIMLTASALGSITIFFSLRALDYPTVWSHFLNWGIPNATGCLAFTPLLVFGPRKNSTGISTPRWITQMFVATLLTLMLLTFILEFLGSETITFLLYFIFGLILFSSLFMSEGALSTLYVVFALVVSIATIYDHGPFSADINISNGATAVSQLYLMALFICGLLVRGLQNDVLVSKTQSKQRALLAQSVNPLWQNYHFEIDLAHQRLVWADPIDRVVHHSARRLSTPGLLLGRLHPNDRISLSLWFKEQQHNANQRFSQTVRMVLHGPEFSRVHIALISDPRAVTRSILNGLLMVYQERYFTECQEP